MHSAGESNEQPPNNFPKSYLADESQHMLQQPPLPTEPPPRAQPCTQQYSQPSQFPNQPTYAQPPVGWQQKDNFNVHHSIDIPAISSLLLREADAWRAVLNLHTSVVAAAQQVARSADNTNDVFIDENNNNSTAREAAYCSALSSLANQCDNLFNEVVRLRALRKTRRTVEVECASDIMRAHSDEVLAIGQALSCSGALSVSSVTAELRVAIQAQRTQLSQLRIFLETIRSASGLSLPSGCNLVVGIKKADGGTDVRDLDDVVKEVYCSSRELSDSTLSDALSKLFFTTQTMSVVQVGGVYMKAVRTVEDKQSKLKERHQEKHNLGKHIDRLIFEGQLSEESSAVGCGGKGLCPMIGRRVARFLGISQRVSAVSTKELDSASVAQDMNVKLANKTDRSELTLSVFGLAPSNKTPQRKLAAAAVAMRSRMETLELRAAQSREAALQQMRSGNKEAAKRDLKRSKALEKQAMSTQSAMDALETQSDILEQTALQKEVAAAIGATAKTLKKEKGLISKAEDAVDVAAEVRDMHDDLSQVMAGLGEATLNDLDDDDLMTELGQMIGKDEEEPDADVRMFSPTQSDSETQERVLYEQKKQREYAEIEDIRLAQHFPEAPKALVGGERRGVGAGRGLGEKVGLLSQ